MIRTSRAGFAPWAVSRRLAVGLDLPPKMRYDQGFQGLEYMRGLTQYGTDFAQVLALRAVPSER